MLTPTKDGAYLVVTLTFQHIAEQAFSLADDEDPRHARCRCSSPNRRAWPTRCRPAARIAYSSAGILAALSQLPLRVVPVATPRPIRIPASSDLTPVLTLPGGIQLAHGDLGVVLTHQAGRRERRRRRARPPTPSSTSRDRCGSRAHCSPQQGAVDLIGLLGAPPVGTRRRLSPDAGISRTGLGDIIVRPLPPIRPTRQPPRRAESRRDRHRGTVAAVPIPEQPGRVRARRRTPHRRRRSRSGSSCGTRASACVRSPPTAR